MGTFKEIFETYGADYTMTMTRFMGNEELYIKFLNMLFEDKSLHDLETALAEADLDRAFEAAHTLKGVVGNMGLTPLYEAVCRIVEPLRRKDIQTDYTVMLQTIKVEFHNAEDLLKSLKEGRRV